MVNNPVKFLRFTGIAEGISFLVLLGIAMPLKYIWGQPAAVRVIGMAHGLIFILFCVALARAMITQKWPVSRGALIFVAALLPFGPFVIDRRLRAWEVTPRAEQSSPQPVRSES